MSLLLGFGHVCKEVTFSKVPGVEGGLMQPTDKRCSSVDTLRLMELSPWATHGFPGLQTFLHDFSLTCLPTGSIPLYSGTLWRCLACLLTRCLPGHPDRCPSWKSFWFLPQQARTSHSYFLLQFLKQRLADLGWTRFASCKVWITIMSRVRWMRTSCKMWVGLFKRGVDGRGL